MYKSCKKLYGFVKIVITNYYCDSMGCNGVKLSGSVCNIEAVNGLLWHLDY